MHKFISMIFLLFFSGYSMATNEKITYGYVEKAILVDKNLAISAKFDTGAKSASLSAIDIKEVKKDDGLYLSFVVPSKQGNVSFISKYIGKVKIKARNGEALSSAPAQHYIKRPVILMNIKIGTKICQIAVNLTNRKRFNYPLLLGRDAIIAFQGVVDPSKAFVIKNEKLNNNVK